MGQARLGGSNRAHRQRQGGTRREGRTGQNITGRTGGDRAGQGRAGQMGAGPYASNNNKNLIPFKLSAEAAAGKPCASDARND